MRQGRYEENQKLAWASEHRGDLETAAYWYQELINISRNDGYFESEMLYTSNLAEMQARSGNLQQSIETATRLLARAREKNSKVFEMRATGRLIEPLLLINARARWKEVVPLLKDGLQLAKQLNVNYWEIYFLLLTAQGYLHLNFIENAYHDLNEALSYITSTTDDYMHLKSRVYWLLARVFLKKHNFIDATYCAELAIGIAREGGVLDFLAQADIVLAETYWREGEKADALKLVEDVSVQSKKLKWKGVEQSSELLLSEFRRELGYYDQALQACERSLHLACEMQTPEEEIKSLLSLGKLLTTISKKKEAQEALQKARRISQEWDYEDHFNTAESLLTP